MQVPRLGEGDRSRQVVGSREAGGVQDAGAVMAGGFDAASMGCTGCGRCQDLVRGIEWQGRQLKMRGRSGDLKLNERESERKQKV